MDEIEQTTIDFHAFNKAADPAHCTVSPCGWHRDFASAYHHKDVNYFRRVIGHPGHWNKTTKDFFTHLTGIKLPKTRHGILAALDQWAGINPEDRQILQQIALDDVIARKMADELRDAEAAAHKVTVEITGVPGTATPQRMPGDQWVKSLIDRGFNQIALRASGGRFKRYAICNYAGQGFKIGGALLRYARALTDTLKAPCRNPE